MRIISAALLAMIVGCSAFGQQRAQTLTAYDDVSYPEYGYAASVSSLRDLDFKNIKVFWFAGKHPDRGVKLRNGAYQHKSDNSYERVNLDLVEFLDQPESGKQRAVIDLEWQDCGGSCTVVGRVQVFELQAGHPTVVQEIEYDRHAPGTGAQFDPRTRTLTITARRDDHTPNCCPGSLDVVRFEWDGKKFVFTSAKAIAVTN